MIENSNAQSRATSAYDRFMIDEDLPMISGFLVNSLRDVPMAPWRRLGCDGAHLKFFGSDGITSMYAGRIAAGAATLPERHRYEKIVYMVQGEGVVEMQHRDHVPQNLMWRAGSLFSPPINMLHRLMNHSNQPALFLAITTAPIAFDDYRADEFISHRDAIFNDRYGAGMDYCASSDGRSLDRKKRERFRQANFIPDVREIPRGGQDSKAGRIKITRFERAESSLIGQLVEWPVGRYRQAHCRDGGVALVILRSTGYSLMWPRELGRQPYDNGLTDQVIRLDWSPGSVFSLPPNWFHQHFNTGAEPAQTLALYCARERLPVTRPAEGADAPRSAPLKQTGRLLEFDVGDPSIRRLYQAELAKNGITPDMSLAAVR